MPSEDYLNAYYNDRYKVPEKRYDAAVAREARGVCRILAERHPKRGRLLEIGASYGTMLDALRADGWDVEGVEIDARAAERARARYGLRVQTGTIETTSLSHTFDVVAMFHVIEHVTAPVTFLNRVRQFMRNDGTLLLKTPNAQAMVARLSKGWWEWFAAPEHVHIYAPESLRRLLKVVGYAPELVVTRRGDAHGTLFEVIRAGLKRVLGSHPSEAAHRTSSSHFVPLSQRTSYRFVQGAMSVLGQPLDAAMQLWWARSLNGPELLVAARARESTS